MSEVKTIKGIDDDTWREFKSLAAKDSLKLGALLKNMLKEYEKTRETFWDKILETEKILTDKEADEFEKIISKKRKEYGFRV